MFEIIDRFCAKTGFKVNYDKTTLYRIGSLKASDVSKYVDKRIKWNVATINVLGVDMVYDSQNLCQINYKNLINKSQAICETWQNRGLSLFGKILMVNTLIMLLYVYKMAVLLCIPKDIVMKLNSVILNFIWDGKKPKIPMKTLYANKEDGGASLIDMELKDQALKANWIKIIHTDKYLSELAFQALCPIMRETIFQCNIGQKDITIFKKSFWQDVLKCWASFNFCHEVKTVKEILDQIIWYNSPIRIDDKIFLFKDACESGLMYIAQIFDVTNGTIIDTNILTQMFELTLMQCNAIISAIPQYWKKKVHSLCQQGIDLGTRNQSKAEQIIVNKKSVSFIYKAINQSDM